MNEFTHEIFNVVQDFFNVRARLDLDNVHILFAREPLIMLMLKFLKVLQRQVLSWSITFAAKLQGLFMIAFQVDDAAHLVGIKVVKPLTVNGVLL